MPGSPPASERPRVLHVDRVVGHGRVAFDAVAGALLAWTVHRRAGVRVDGPGPVAPAVVVEVAAGPRLLGLAGRCHVEQAVVTSDLVAFTYRAEPGHPERGTETFRVTIDGDDAVRFAVTARSVPVHPLLRLPVVGRAAQRVQTWRYVAAARSVARDAARTPPHRAAAPARPSLGRPPATS